ncbi:MAG: BMC domain-containing protein [Deltaproteobacteria bacterium]|nr:BMC domain-containing protein [Deltaproteobacteria bacterium]
MLGPALAIIELGSIARGYVALDAANKRAVVQVVCAEPVSSGRYWFALRGGEAEVEEAFLAACSAAHASKFDSLLLPFASEDIFEVLGGTFQRKAMLDAVGVVESGSICSAVRAVDAALKAADVSLADLHLGAGIAGKAYFVVTGGQSSVEAAVEAGCEAAGTTWLIGHEVLANPDVAIHAITGNRQSKR